MDGHRNNCFACGWIRYSAFDSHLNYDCINRQVWLPGAQDENLVGGDGFIAPSTHLSSNAIEGDNGPISTALTVTDHKTTSITASSDSNNGRAGSEQLQSLTNVYRGQASTFKNSVEAAQRRDDIDKFMVKIADTVRV